MDLEYSNKYDDPTWSRSYSAKEEYRMASLLPEEWHKLYEEMKTNSKLLDIYYKLVPFALFFALHPFILGFVE